MSDERAEDRSEAAPDDEPGPMTWITPGYRVARALSRLLFLPGGRRYEGLEHVPESGGCVIAANHLSFLDIPLVAASLDRHVCFVARDTLARSRPLAWLMRQCGAVLVRRGQADRPALREMGAHLERGDCLAIFPEGTRSPDGRMGEFRRGALMVARQAGVPIVPAGIRGTGRFLGTGQKLPRPGPVSIRYAAAIDPMEPDALARARQAIASLIGDEAPVRAGEPPRE